MTITEGTEPEPAARKTSNLRPLIFLGLLVAIVILVKVFNLQQHLEKERLRQAIAAYGAWGPFIYLIIWTLAPPLFLPGLPITLAGGILFGPFWGVVYTICGATAGATLAFLVARYLARDWVEARIAGTKIEALDQKVAEHGWKVVAFTRLIPIFPFFLLNYAFGLTRISLAAYVTASFIFMLPVTIVFVYFSSNILDVFQGRVSKEFLIGAVLVALVSLVPWIYKKYKAKKGESPDLPDI
ncbi:MAG: TVP38/TMEM64 family protein [Deltaproteobacteria bacterium]|nr:TVP38/TMEM64 family protein [Deltaproteobacteria bacterium]